MGEYEGAFLEMKLDFEGFTFGDLSLVRLSSGTLLCSGIR